MHSTFEEALKKKYVKGQVVLIGGKQEKKKAAVFSSQACK